MIRIRKVPILASTNQPLVLRTSLKVLSVSWLKDGRWLMFGTFGISALTFSGSLRLQQ